MIVASLLLCLACQESVDALLESLASDDPAHRCRAADRLLSRWKEWTAGDLGTLARAEASPDPEVSRRARDVARRIELRRQLGSLMKEFPDADAVLYHGDEEERLSYLLAASLKARQEKWADDVLRPMVLNAGTFGDAGRLYSSVTGADHRGLLPLLVPLALNGPYRIDAMRCLHAGSKEDIRRLLPCLEDEDARVRAAAVSLIGWILRDAAASALRPLFKDESVEVRRALLSIVGDGRIRPLADQVGPFLEAWDADSRNLAIFTVGRLRLKTHTRALVPLLQDWDPSVRSRAAEILGEFEAKEHADAIAPLLQDPNLGVRMSAVRGLGTMDAREHADAIALLLSDPEPGARGEAAGVLGRWHQRSRAKAILPLLDEEKTRTEAILALWNLEAKEAAAPLMALAESRDPELKRGGDRERAIRAVGAIGAVEMVPRIADLRQDPDGQVRMAVFEALARLGDAGSSDLMADYLIDPFAVHEASRGLAMLAPQRLAARLGRLVTFNTPTCTAAMGALGGIGGEDARRALLPLLKGPKDYSEEAVLALTRIGLPEDAEALLPLLEDDRGGFVAIAIGELASRGGTHRKAAIEKLSSTPTLGARIALTRLGQQSTREQVAILQEMLAPEPPTSPDFPPHERTDYGPDGMALERALEAIHEPEAFARFEKEIVLVKPVDTLDDLRTLLRQFGFTLDVGEAERWGRLPAGTRTTLRAVCDWMLDENSEWERLEDGSISHTRRVVLQGSTVTLLRLRRQVEYWRKRLEG